MIGRLGIRRSGIGRTFNARWAEQIADFALFIMAKRQITPEYEDWDGSQWQDFALGQLFREEDEVEYSLQDAAEIY